MATTSMPTTDMAASPNERELQHQIHECIATLRNSGSGADRDPATAPQITIDKLARMIDLNARVGGLSPSRDATLYEIIARARENRVAADPRAAPDPRPTVMQGRLARRHWNAEERCHSRLSLEIMSACAWIEGISPEPVKILCLPTLEERSGYDVVSRYQVGVYNKITALINANLSSVTAQPQAVQDAIVTWHDRLQREMATILDVESRVLPSTMAFPRDRNRLASSASTYDDWLQHNTPVVDMLLACQRIFSEDILSVLLVPAMVHYLTFHDWNQIQASERAVFGFRLHRWACAIPQHTMSRDDLVEAAWDIIQESDRHASSRAVRALAEAPARVKPPFFFSEEFARQSAIDIKQRFRGLAKPELLWATTMETLLHSMRHVQVDEQHYSALNTMLKFIRCHSNGHPEHLVRKELLHQVRAQFDLVCYECYSQMPTGAIDDANLPSVRAAVARHFASFEEKEVATVQLSARPFETLEQCATQTTAVAPAGITGTDEDLANSRRQCATADLEDQDQMPTPSIHSDSDAEREDGDDPTDSASPADDSASSTADSSSSADDPETPVVKTAKKPVVGKKRGPKPKTKHPTRPDRVADRDIALFLASQKGRLPAQRKAKYPWLVDKKGFVKHEFQLGIFTQKDTGGSPIISEELAKKRRLYDSHKVKDYRRLVDPLYKVTHNVAGNVKKRQLSLNTQGREGGGRFGKVPLNPEATSWSARGIHAARDQIATNPAHPQLAQSTRVTSKMKATDSEALQLTNALADTVQAREEWRQKSRQADRAASELQTLLTKFDDGEDQVKEHIETLSWLHQIHGWRMNKNKEIADLKSELAALKEENAQLKRTLDDQEEEDAEPAETPELDDQD